MAELALPPILARGTRLVTKVEATEETEERTYPAGTVAVVGTPPETPEGIYRVRFLDGREALLRRVDVAVLSHFHRVETDAPETGVDLYEFVAYRCIVGSQAYGLEGESSDTDRRGFYIPPAALHWSLYGVPEQLENAATEEVYWEVQKFLNLALRANPNVLECLYSPLVEHADPLAQELLAMRDAFLSKLVYQTYNGYVMGQFKRLEADVRTTGSIRWKHAMHLIRLLLSGITVLKEGFVPLSVEAYRERLLEIRRGEVPWEEVDAWRLDLHRRFDAAFATTSLPDRPDTEQANEWLIRVRRTMAERER